jgi:thiamine pyrophosphokinase
MRAVIFANGEFHQPENLRQILQPADIIIAVDGGAQHCAHIGLLPHYAIGDFDSLTQAELEDLIAKGVQLVRFPTRKDFTDLELALHHALSLHCSQILIFGALGARWDQTLANLLLLTSPDFANLAVHLMDDNQEITLLRPGRTQRLSGNPGDTLSLIPLTGDANGISTQGLEYPLSNETLFLGSTRGVSNVFTRPEATITFERGLLLCIIIHHQIALEQNETNA